MTYPMVRQSPSGPIVGYKNGAQLQFDNRMTVVTNGAIIETPREVQANMTNTTPTMRPELIAPAGDSWIWVEGDLDINFTENWLTQDLRFAIQVSFDGGTVWQTLNTMDCPVTGVNAGVHNNAGNRLHFKPSATFTPLAVLPGFTPGVNVVARLMVSNPDDLTGDATVVPDNGPTVRLGIHEIFHT